MDVNALKFLQATPHLESLELSGLRVQPPPETALVLIGLPRVAKLVTGDVENGPLFVRPTFPSLGSLTINPVEDGVSPTEVVWNRLQASPTIPT